MTRLAVMVFGLAMMPAAIYVLVRGTSIREEAQVLPWSPAAFGVAAVFLFFGCLIVYLGKNIDN